MSEHTIPLLGLSAQGKPCNWAPWLPWKAGWQLRSASFSLPPPGSTEWAPHSPSQIGCEDLLISMRRMFPCQIRAWDSRHFLLFFNARLPNFQKTVKPVSGTINVDNYSHQNDLSNVFLDLGLGTAFFLFFFLVFIRVCLLDNVVLIPAVQQSESAMLIHIFLLFFLDFLPIWVTTEHWVEFPGLYSRVSLVIYFIHSINSVYSQSQSPRSSYHLEQMYGHGKGKRRSRDGFWAVLSSFFPREWE